MEFLDGAPTWFRNARIVTADRVFSGRLRVVDGRIEEIGEDGWQPTPTAVPQWRNSPSPK